MKNHRKDTSHLKSNKNSLHSNRFKNDMGKKRGRGGGGGKNEKEKKSLTTQQRQ